MKNNIAAYNLITVSIIFSLNPYPAFLSTYVNDLIHTSLITEIHTQA
jgi:hypothetical protein